MLFNLEIAKRCGLKQVGSETGSVNGDAWTYNPENHTVESFEVVEKVFGQFKTELIGKNKIFLVEAVYDHVIYNGEVLSKLLDKLDCDKYKVTFDLVNLLNVDNYKDYEKIAIDFLENFHDRIELLHLKNFVIEDNKKVNVRFNKGFMDYKKIIELIDKYNLTDIPCIVEEIDGEDLQESILYLETLV